jgi:hypothetical protein
VIEREAVEAFEIVGEADQFPFERDFGQSVQAEAPKSQHFFDHAEGRFDGLLPLRPCIRTAHSQKSGCRRSSRFEVLNAPQASRSERASRYWLPESG